MKITQATPIIFSEEYSSLEGLSYGAKRWNLNFKKTSPGKIQAGLKMIDNGTFQISEIKIRGKVLQNGTAPENYSTIIVPGDEMQSFKWQYLDITSSTLLVMPRDKIFSAITSDSFHVFTISIHNTYLTKIARKLNLHDLSDKLGEPEQIYPISKNMLRLLISYINVLFYDFPIKDKSHPLEEELSNTINKLTQLLLTYINDQKVRIPQVKIRKIDEAALKFLEIYNCAEIPDMSIDVFCRNMHIKQRTLEKAIHEYFGVSPISLLKALKLNLFRKKLLVNNSPISVAANECGFKHHGQLSADYKKLFGELPSDTLKSLKQMNNPTSF